MNGTGFTRGPWVLDNVDGSFRIYAGIFSGAQRAVVEIADVWRTETKDGDTAKAANAHLIAAAPELYEALKQLSFAAQTSGGVAGRDEELCAAIAQAEAALAKAALISQSEKTE